MDWLSSQPYVSYSPVMWFEAFGSNVICGLIFPQPYLWYLNSTFGNIFCLRYHSLRIQSGEPYELLLLVLYGTGGAILSLGICHFSLTRWLMIFYSIAGPGLELVRNILITPLCSAKLSLGWFISCWYICL